MGRSNKPRETRHTASSPGPRKQDARAHARPQAPPTAPHRTGARASTKRSAARDGDTTRLHPLEAHDELDELELVGRPWQRDHEQHAPEMAHTKRCVTRRRVVPPVARAQARPRRRRCARRPSCDAVRGDMWCNGAAVAKRSAESRCAAAAYAGGVIMSNEHCNKYVCLSSGISLEYVARVVLDRQLHNTCHLVNLLCVVGGRVFATHLNAQ